MQIILVNQYMGTNEVNSYNSQGYQCVGEYNIRK